MGVQYDSTESGVCHRNIHAGNFPDLLLAAKHQDMLILFSQHCLKVDLFKKRKKKRVLVQIVFAFMLQKHYV